VFLQQNDEEDAEEGEDGDCFAVVPVRTVDGQWFFMDQYDYDSGLYVGRLVNADGTVAVVSYHLDNLLP